MDSIQRFVARAEKYAKRRDLSLSYVSRLILNDGRRLANLKKGVSRMFPDTLERANKKLDELEAKPVQRVS